MHCSNERKGTDYSDFPNVLAEQSVLFSAIGGIEQKRSYIITVFLTTYCFTFSDLSTLVKTPAESFQTSIQSGFHSRIDIGEQCFCLYSVMGSQFFERCSKGYNEVMRINVEKKNQLLDIVCSIGD